MQERKSALLLIAAVSKYLGWVVAVATIVLGILTGDILITVGAILVALVACVGLHAMAECSVVLLHIEQNTRMAADAAQKAVRR